MRHGHRLAPIFALVAFAACSSTPITTAADVQMEAAAQFNRAVALLNEGKIHESWQAMQHVDALIEGYLYDDHPFRDGSSDRAEQLVLDRSLRDWQTEWSESYRLNARIAWPAVVQALEDETMDLSLLRGYVSTFLGREHVNRLNNEYRHLEPVFLARRAQQYWYSCQDMAELCRIVRDAVAARMPAGAVTTSWTGDRDDYRGVIDVETRVLREAFYQKGKETTGSIPSAIELSVNVDTRAGSSRWDGEFTVTLEGALPERIGRYDYPRVSEAHWDALKRDLGQKMVGWPR